eukprot:SAG31_NODE_1323_length_8792_cov_16.597032_6_plen_353_part_00
MSYEYWQRCAAREGRQNLSKAKPQLDLLHHVNDLNSRESERTVGPAPWDRPGPAQNVTDQYGSCRLEMRCASNTPAPVLDDMAAFAGGPVHSASCDFETRTETERQGHRDRDTETRTETEGQGQRQRDRGRSRGVRASAPRACLSKHPTRGDSHGANVCGMRITPADHIQQKHRPQSTFANSSYLEQYRRRVSVSKQAANTDSRRPAPANSADAYNNLARELTHDVDILPSLHISVDRTVQLRRRVLAEIKKVESRMATAPYGHDDSLHCTTELQQLQEFLRTISSASENLDACVKKAALPRDKRLANCNSKQSKFRSHIISATTTRPQATSSIALEDLSLLSSINANSSAV